MAEVLLKKYLATEGVSTVAVNSAGLGASGGKGADPRAVIVARELGVSLDGHSARPVTPELVAAADALFVMDFGNGAELLGRFPQARRKMHMLGAFAGGESSSAVEIRDPFGGDTNDVRRCYEVLDRCTRSVASILARSV
jgi:protein-tyrosine-phosphatase